MEVARSQREKLSRKEPRRRGGHLGLAVRGDGEGRMSLEGRRTLDSDGREAEGSPWLLGTSAEWELAQAVIKEG